MDNNFIEIYRKGARGKKIILTSTKLKMLLLLLMYQDKICIKRGKTYYSLNDKEYILQK